MLIDRFFTLADIFGFNSLDNLFMLIVRRVILQLVKVFIEN